MDAGTRISLIVLFLLAGLAGLFAAHTQHLSAAGSAPVMQPTPIPPPAPNEVEVIPGSESGTGNSVLSPSVLTVHVGQKVTFVNTDTQDTTFTADNGAFDSNVLSPGQSYTWTPKSPGRYTYGCYLRPDEQGIIIVQP